MLGHYDWYHTSTNEKYASNNSIALHMRCIEMGVSNGSGKCRGWRAFVFEQFSAVDKICYLNVGNVLHLCKILVFTVWLLR